MQLKQYQINTLNVLQKFFETARICGAKEAFARITAEPEIKSRLGKLASDYIVWNTIPYTPRVCLKVPTGGGKTILAAHSVKIAADTWLEKEFPLVLWFCPSDTIRQQTAEALKNPRHPYREALDEQFGGRVKVFDIEEKFNIRPADIEQNLCIVVSSIQAFRRRDTDTLIVYKHNENLEPHFAHITATEGMEKDENGKVKFSFANLLYHHRPLMILDEAHNVVTNLSEEMQGRINPSAILEFTATPRLRDNTIYNNTLYNVRAAELKEEEMIKLPIVLTEHNNWELAVTEAIAKRAELEKAAEHENEYVRPVLLFQAQDKNGEISVEVLKKHLIEIQNIPENEIAVATGEQKELDGINIFDANCPIRYIITVQALKEGWDCSFAYVLCSLANVHSDTAVEQLLGRVMRMPYAKARKITALNKAYAYVLSSRFGDSTECIVNKLEDKKGFSDEEALSVVEQKPCNFGLFGIKAENKILLKPENVIPPKELPASITLHRENNGANSLCFTAETTKKDIEKVKLFLDEKQIFELESKFANYTQTINENSPAKNGEQFAAPRMMIEIQGNLEFADGDIVFENFDWNLEDYASYRLEPSEFRMEKQGNGFMIDIDNNSLKYSIAREEQMTMSFVDTSNWTEDHLIRWLDSQLRNMYFSQGIMLAWLTKAVGYLTQNRGFSISELMVAKYALANKLKAKIEEAFRKAKQSSFQQSFFAPQSRVELDFNNGFKFFDSMYDGEIFYHGNYEFSKHYLGSKRVPQFDGGQDGEEFNCAKVIDGNKNVKFWLRNVAKNTNSFWLPTSTDKFYPDFIVQLNDGRILVVEYKGEHLVDNADSREKNNIGKLWANKSGGKCLFLMAQKMKNGLTTAEQIEFSVNLQH